MAKEKYEEHRFSAKNLQLISIIEGIMNEYAVAGYTMTLRQLYYQLVARDHIPNTMLSYKNTGVTVNAARMAGLLDWDIIEDRTRGFLARTRWDSPEQILKSAAASYHEDMWADQPARVFCLVEKEALVGVLDRTCSRYDVPLLAAKGYPSVTVLRDFALYKIWPAIRRDGQNITVLHLGDHDPSGLDMTRDICDRLNIFLPEGHGQLNVRRIALNMDQIRVYKPPENPAKITDSRFAGYMQQHGRHSWELDALPPDVLDRLVTTHVETELDMERWNAKLAAIAATKANLERFGAEYGNIIARLDKDHQCYFCMTEGC